MIRCSVCLEPVGEDVDRSTGDPVCESCSFEHELRADSICAAYLAGTRETERVAIGAIRRGDLVAETGAGPFLPVLVNVPGLLRVDARAPGAPEPIGWDSATSLSTTVVRLVGAR